MSINYVRNKAEKLEEQFEEMQFAIDEFEEKQTKTNKNEAIKQVTKTQKLLAETKTAIKNIFLGR